MSDTSAIRDALGGYVEKKNQGDNASLRSALNDLKYTVRQSVYNTPYPNTPAPSAPKPTTPPTQPTTTPTQTAGAVQPPASVSGAPQVTYAPSVTPPQDLGANIAGNFPEGVQNVAGMTGLPQDNPLVQIGGNLLGAAQSVGDVLGAVGQGINELPVVGDFAEEAGKAVAWGLDAYNRNINEPVAGIASALLPYTGVSGKFVVLGQAMTANASGNTERAVELLKQFKDPLDFSALAPDQATQAIGTNTWDKISNGDVGGAAQGLLDLFNAYGEQQYHKLDPATALAASLVFDPLNFVPGLGIGKMQKASKLAEITQDVGRIENVAELLPKGVMGRIMTPAAKVTETVKSALQNIGLRTQYANSADELFSTYRAFEKAGQDAKGFEQIAKTYAGMANIPAQRASRLVQGFGKQLDEIEQGYRTMETVLRGADELADVSKLPKTFQNFIKDVRAGTASADDALDVLKAEMATRTSKYFAEQGAKLFPVKGMAAPVKVAERFMNELRGFESLVYIGLSPFTFVRNVINGVSTMAIEGLNPLWDASREIGRLTKMGQVGKAKELQRAIEFQETLMKTGRNVREAMGLGTYGTGATGYFGNFMSNMIHGTPIGKPLQWYQRMENSMRARVWSQTYYRALQHNWDVGKFIPEMDAVTQAVLHQYRVDPQKIMGIVREAGVHDKAAVVREVLNYLRGQRGEALDLERLAEEMGLSKQQLMSFLDEHDVAKAQSMAQEISAQVANGKHPAQAVNDVVGQAARDTAEEVIARTGAQAPDQVGMTLQELEARRGELVAQWAAASKTRGGRKIADDLAAEIDAVERELERLGYGNAPEAAQVAQAAPNVAPEAAQAAEQVAQEAGTIVLPEVLRGTMYADEWAQMTDAQREFVIGLERAKQTPMQTAPMEVLPQVADTYQAVGDVPTLMPDVTTGVPAPKEAPPTLGDVAKAAQGKGIATATAEGKPLNKHLLNVLNKHAEENGVAKFANMADVQARAEDALKILDSYAPSNAPASVQKAVDEMKRLVIPPQTTSGAVDNSLGMLRVPPKDVAPPASDMAKLPETPPAPAPTSAPVSDVGNVADVTPPAPPKEMSVSEHFAAATREFPSYPKSDVQITGANDGFVTFADGSKRRRIGQGTQKDVYPLDDGRVVKVARNTEYGDGYIEVEAYNYFNAPPEVQKNLARVEGVGTYTDAAGKEHKFLVVENVTNIDAMQPTKAQMDAVESYFGRGDYGFNANGKAKQWGKTADGRVVLADYQNFKAMAEDTRRAAERAKQLEGNANPLVAYLAKKGIGQSLYNDILSGTIDEKRFMEWIDSMRDSSLLSKEQHAELTRLFEKRNLAPPTQPIPPPTPEAPSAPSVANDSALAQYEQAQRELKNAINAKYNSPRERADAIDAAREKVNQARVNAESPQYAQYAIGEKVWFKGDEYTIIGDQKQISGGWFQDAERADGKKITVPTKGTLENQVSKSRASSQQMQEGFRRLKQSETPPAPQPPSAVPSAPTRGKKATAKNVIAEVPNAPKEAWQMTREEYLNGAATNLTQDVRAQVAGKPYQGGIKIGDQRSHFEIVRDALSEGKPVPAEVLADYPDLAAKYGNAQAGGVAKGNIRNVSDQSIRGVDPNEMHNAQRGYSQRFNAQAEIDNLRQVATEDPQAVSTLSRDEMLKAKARTQADMYEALMRVYNSEPAARVRVGTDAENRVMAWLRRDVFNGMDESRAAAQVAADWMDNAVMISRDGETHFDSALNWLSPFQFWGTRYALQSARRVADKPARLMWYLKLRDMQDQVENDPRFPKRLRGMMTLPFPGAPKWAGSMWFDPLETFTQIESVFKMNQFDNALTDSDVAGAIRALVESGRVSPSEAANAIANKSGALWDATKAQMEEATKQQEGLDSITTAFKPHMPFDIIWKLRTGNAADIGVLFPMTRLIRNTTSLAPQGSFLNPTGTGINIEQPIKAGLRALTGNQSIPDWDQWEQYRVDRALADMVGDGTISERDALIAMIERKGGWYDEAQRRAQEQMRTQNFTSVFGGQMFPQGEQEYYKARVLKDQLINQAVAQLGGNPNDLSYGEKMELIRANGLNKKGTPLGDFYDQNPVYNARGDAYAEPEERLKGFLTDEVWQKYLALSALDKRMARQGNKDLAAFITNPERDYKAVTLEKAAEWVKYLRGYLPEAEQTPKVGALNQIQFAPPDLAAAYQTMQDEQKTLFNLDAMQPRMDARAKMTPNEKRAFDAANPDVAAYYKWYGQKMKENPALAKLIHPDTQNNYAANYNQQATNNYLTDQVVKNLNRMVGKLDDSRARRFNPNSRSNKPRPLSRSAVMALAQKKANPNYYLPRDVYRELIAAFKASGLRMAFEQWLQMMAAQGGV